MSSNAKRLWVINLTTICTILSLLENTGNEFATSFQIQLNRISIGFYAGRNTAENTENLD
jgi:hypothetical protein